MFSEGLGGLRVSITSPTAAAAAAAIPPSLPTPYTYLQVRMNPLYV